ncbi:MAG: hypothetical protein K8I30_09960 [Anaerolineae bacterium]|nr:hypothetical protein [Anaerolineae bacterium]
MTTKSKDELLSRYLETHPDRFMSLLVHDVRVPLSNIVSGAKLIQMLLDEDETIDKAQILELVTIITNSAESVRDLLEVAVQYDRAHRSSSPVNPVAQPEKVD